VAALLPDQAADPAPLLVLPDTGLVRAATGGWHLLADVGEPCPAELPAHAHADTLGCLVHADGAPLLVDTGTSTYAPGPVRGYERSTAAHNTAEIDGCDSTEVWGAFRAGRRARVHGVAADAGGAGSITAEAAHDGYRRHGGRPVHHRRWSLTSAGLRVDDELTGGGRHAIVVRWHLAPGTSVLRLADRGAVITAGPSPEGPGRFEVTVAGSHPFWLMVEHAPVAAGFGHTTQAPVLTCRIDSVLPARISTRWRRAGTTWEAA
jgi:uncharacterized heparinase superfamily protein